MTLLHPFKQFLFVSTPSCPPGGPNYLSEEDAATIDQRLDEAYRRKMITSGD